MNLKRLTIMLTCAWVVSWLSFVDFHSIVELELKYVPVARAASPLPPVAVEYEVEARGTSVWMRVHVTYDPQGLKAYGCLPDALRIMVASTHTEGPFVANELLPLDPTSSYLRTEWFFVGKQGSWLRGSAVVNVEGEGASHLVESFPFYLDARSAAPHSTSSRDFRAEHQQLVLPQTTTASVKNLEPGDIPGEGIGQ